MVVKDVILAEGFPAVLSRQVSTAGFRRGLGGIRQKGCQCDSCQCGTLGEKKGEGCYGLVCVCSYMLQVNDCTDWLLTTTAAPCGLSSRVVRTDGCSRSHQHITTTCMRPHPPLTLKTTSLFTPLENVHSEWGSLAKERLGLFRAHRGSCTASITLCSQLRQHYIACCEY